MSDQTSFSLPPSDSTSENRLSLSEITLQMLQQIANGTLILATLLLFVSLYSTLQTRNTLPASLGIIFFVLSVLAAFIRRFSPEIRAWLLIAAFGFIGISGVSIQSFTAAGLVALLVSVILATQLLDHMQWRGLLIAEVGITLVITLLHSLRLIRWENILVNENSLFFWGSLLAVTLFLAWLLSAAIANSLNVLKQWLNETLLKNDALTSKYDSMNRRNKSLEQLLDRRKYLSISARQFTRDISAQPTPESAMQMAIALIQRQFDFYHTGIFLTDERSEFAVLKAGTGEAGAQMLARQHRLRIREEGVVGFVVARGETRIVGEVDQDAVHFKNPSLPLTQSEMAVPLVVGNKVIGALDVQSVEPNAFDEETIDLLQSVASVLALSIDHTSKITALQRELADFTEKEKAAAGKSWQIHLKGSRKNLNYHFRGSDAASAVGNIAAASELKSTGAITAKPASDAIDGTRSTTTISLPIKLRDQVLGNVNLKVNGQVAPAELTQLVASATDRLALALENARLLEEIQERADREHLVADISDRVRAASDIDTILKTTVQELGKTMGIGEVRIQLKTLEAQ